ncbi:MAG TPA: MMPL family transporter, partial [Pseudomonadota bacterium]|nr:MMPL family transporter [Pseudomonadota bacterium]
MLHLPENRPAERPSALDRAVVRYVAVSSSRAGTVLALFATLAVLSLWPTIQLLGNLHTDLVDLLPLGHPAVEALRQVGPRQISSTNLVVILESPDPTANRRLAEALRPSLSALRGSLFTDIQWQPDNEVGEFLYRTRFLYAERADLEAAEVLLERVLARRTSPLLVDLEGDSEAELARLRLRLRPRELPAVATVTDPTQVAPGYFEHHPANSPTHYLGIMLWRRSDGLATLGDQATLDAVRALVTRAQPSRFHPQMKVEYSGAIAMALTEQRAVRDDLSLASTLCAALVLLSIFGFFRRFTVLLAVGAPAVFGLLLTLAIAYFTLGSLNANSAFLISIILGNGINSPILLLARYGEERRAGLPFSAAMSTAIGATRRGTLTAM